MQLHIESASIVRLVKELLFYFGIVNATYALYLNDLSSLRCHFCAL